MFLLGAAILNLVWPDVEISQLVEFLSELVPGRHVFSAYLTTLCKRITSAEDWMVCGFVKMVLFCYQLGLQVWVLVVFGLENRCQVGNTILPPLLVIA